MLKMKQDIFQAIADPTRRAILTLYQLDIKNAIKSIFVKKISTD